MLITHCNMQNALMKRKDGNVLGSILNVYLSQEIPCKEGGND